MSNLLLKKLLIATGMARLIPKVRRVTHGGEAFLHYYSDRLLAAPHEGLLQISHYMQMHEPDGIDLAQGTPRFDVLPSTTSKLPADRRGYPSIRGLPELREVLADKLWTDYLLRVRASEEVLVTAGASGALALALDTFINPGHGVVLFDPCSWLYPLALKQRRARIRWIATKVEEGRLRFRLDHLARVMRGARMIVLCHPNNPNGGFFAQDDLEQICWWANRFDTLILHDTTFAAYQYEGPPCKLAISPQAERRTITIGSVSKGHALTSARVGWLAGQRYLTGACAVLAGAQTAMVPTFCQQLALSALKLDAKLLEPIRKEFAARRQYTFDRLTALGLPSALPAGTFFFWVPVQHLQRTGKQFAEQLRQEGKVLVWPGEFFGPSGKYYVRISFAGDEGRLREGLSRLADFVRQIQNPTDKPPPQKWSFFKKTAPLAVK